MRGVIDGILHGAADHPGLANLLFCLACCGLLLGGIFAYWRYRDH